MAAVTVVMSGDDAKLRAAHERLLAAQQKLLDKYKNLGNESENSGKKAVKHSDAIGNSIVGAAAKYATAAGAMQLAVQGISKAWDLVKVSHERAMSAMDAGAGANTQLLQVATAKPGMTAAQDFAQLKQTADQIAFAAGATREMGKKVMFEARSQGFEKDAAEILSYHQVFGDMDTATSIAGKIPKMFPKSGITPIPALSKAMAAAGTSPEDFKRFGDAVSTAAAGGGIAGDSPEELMATLAIWGSQFKSGAIAADRLKQFSVKTGMNKDMAGMGAMAAFKKLQAGPESTREDFLGDSSELREAYATWEKTITAVESETKRLMGVGNVLQEKKMIADSDIEMTAIRKRNRAQARLESATIGQFGAAAGTSAAIEANIQTQLIDKSLPRRMAGGASAGIVGTLTAMGGMDEQTGTAIGIGVAKAITDAFQGGLAKSLIDWVRGVDTFEQAVQRLNNGTIGTNAARAQAATADPKFAAQRKLIGAQQALAAKQSDEFGVAGAMAGTITANIKKELTTAGTTTRLAGGRTAGAVGAFAGEVGLSEKAGTAIGVEVARAIGNPLLALHDLKDAITDALMGVRDASDRMTNASNVNAARAQAATANP